jgi:transcriptional regulator of acetoin/glycerol metabolism
LFFHRLNRATATLPKDYGRIGKYYQHRTKRVVQARVKKLRQHKVKLLRVLQEQEFEPIGSSKTIKVNVRIVAACHARAPPRPPGRTLNFIPSGELC